MTDVPYKPEEQALKRIEEQQRAEMQRKLERKITKTEPASGSAAFEPEPASENEKLKLAVSDQRFARNAEAEYNLKQRYAPGEGPADVYSKEVKPMFRGDSHLERPQPKAETPDRDAMERRIQRAERPLDKRDLFREEQQQLMERDLSEKEKGEIGEQAMVKEEERLERKMLLHHADKPNKPGFDGVSWDPKERRLYVIEAKNYQESPTVTAKKLSAFREQRQQVNIDEASNAIRNSDLSKGDKIAAQSALRNRKFTAELYVPDDVRVSGSAHRLLSSMGGDVIIKQYDGRILWSQERKVIGRLL